MTTKTAGLGLTLMVLTFTSLLIFSCNRNDTARQKQSTAGAGTEEAGITQKAATLESSNTGSSETKIADTSKRPIVTFIEFGSVDCVPCKMMVPVMEKVEVTYGDKVKVVFHDVWTDDGQPEGRKYGIRAIPTQVFLDADGKEFFRHEGYFPFEQLDQVLKQGGVN